MLTLIFYLLLLLLPMLFPVILVANWFSFAQYQAQVLANKLVKSKMKRQGLKNLDWAKAWLRSPYKAYLPAVFKLVLLIPTFGLLNYWFAGSSLNSYLTLYAWPNYFKFFGIAILGSAFIAFLTTYVQSPVRFSTELHKTLLLRIAQNAGREETYEIFSFAARELETRAFLGTIAPDLLPYMSQEELERLANELKGKDHKKHSAFFKYAASKSTSNPILPPNKEDLQKAIRKVDFESSVNGNMLRALFMRKVELGQANAAMEKMISGFAAFYRNPTAIYCSKCQRRPLAIVKEPWHWWTCPVCREFGNLLPNVQAVHGHIGDFDQLDEADGTLHFQLWDRFSNSAVAAELDILEIHPGKQVNLELASFLEKVDNHLPKEAIHFKCVLHNGLVLEHNLMRQIESFGLLGPAKS